MKTTSDLVYLQPLTTAEALNMIREAGEGARFVAGGTDYFVNSFQGNEPRSPVIDISGIESLKFIRKKASSIHVGALVSLHQLERSVLISKEFPSLVKAAKSVATPVIRMTATLGGNLLCENRCIYYNQSEWWREAAGFCLKCDGAVCIATGGSRQCFSEFVSDTAPLLISLEAEIVIENAGGERKMPLEQIYTGDGVNPRCLSNNELVKEIIIPLGKVKRSIFRKLRSRESIDFTSLTTAVSLLGNNSLKVVLGGVDPGPVIATGYLHDDKEEMIRELVKKSRAVNNEVYSRNYRRKLIRITLEECFREMENVNVNNLKV